MAANSKTSGNKRSPNQGSWKPGQSGNPKGAPKRGESWAEIIKRIGELTPTEAAALSKEIAGKLKAIGDDVTLKQAVVLRVYAALLFDPQPGMLNAFMERTEGKVKDVLQLHTWQSELVEAIKSGELKPDELVKELGLEDARSILIAAGAPVPDGAPTPEGEA